MTLCLQFVLTIFQTVRVFVRSLLFGEQKPVPENRLLDMINFALNTGPRGFWRKPTGINAGRSLGAFVRYVFYKESSFTPLAPSDSNTRKHEKK